MLRALDGTGKECAVTPVAREELHRLMPIERHNGHLLNTDGDMAIHEPGAYQHVLDRKCDQDAHSAPADYLLAETDEQLAAWHEAKAQRKAALIAERSGKPIKVQAYMLPRGLSAPFERWTGGEHRMFVVTPDDTITLVPRETRSA